MLREILLAAQTNNEANRPVRLIPADVVTPAPDLKIRLWNDDKQIYKSEHFIIPESLTKHTKQVTIDGVVSSCTFNDELQAGDELMVVSLQGLDSTKFFILDRVIQWE
ncbi:hypothetical protein BTO30_12560 [Domibacillus antri]|uniref:DUF2577 domain-containing protein n=1 Tax=Domibacillus antri TaxID=1714264 RepID=A0A1Q8Q3B2_9BACI|nr:DUF2577 family protein [Domibacillus antri]OLN21846.1 hypothetical protein BTO30_12560 [Domibacillus antri]